MASKALVTISGTPFPSSPNKPRISTASFNAHFSSFKPNPTAASRISSSTGFVSTAVPITRKRSVFVRAEANSDGDDANPDNAAAVAPEEDPEAQVEAEAEDKDEEEKPTAAAQRKPRVKLGEIMGILNKRAVEAAEKERPTPDIRTGDVVEIKLEVPENRRRVSIYKGIVMSKQNAGIHTTIRIRRIIAGIGVEIVFPVYSPNIKEIKVVSHRKVRRARLYYLRDKLPKFSTFK